MLTRGPLVFLADLCVVTVDKQLSEPAGLACVVNPGGWDVVGMAQTHPCWDQPLQQYRQVLSDLPKVK